MRPNRPQQHRDNTDRQTHYLDCKRLWSNILLAYRSCSNVQLEHTRLHALCIITPWEAERPDPAIINRHAVCLAAALDVFQAQSNKQKLNSGKCHARDEQKLPRNNQRHPTRTRQRSDTKNKSPPEDPLDPLRE